MKELIKRLQEVADTSAELLRGHTLSLPLRNRVYEIHTNVDSTAKQLNASNHDKSQLTTSDAVTTGRHSVAEGLQ